MARPPTQPSTLARRRLVAIVGLAGTAAVGAGLSCSARQRPVDAFCAELRTMEDLDELLASPDRSTAGDQASRIERLRGAAPEEIEPHVARLASVTEELSRTMGTARDPGAAATEVFARRRGEVADITASGRAVEAYADQHCTVVLNPPEQILTPGATPSTTVAPSTRAGGQTSRRPTTRSGTKTPTTRSKGTTTRRPAASTSRPKTTTTRRR